MSHDDKTKPLKRSSYPSSSPPSGHKQVGDVDNRKWTHLCPKIHSSIIQNKLYAKPFFLNLLFNFSIWWMMYI